MNRRRPGLVIVIAILNLTLGGLGLFLLCLDGIALLAEPALKKELEEDEPSSEMELELDQALEQLPGSGLIAIIVSIPVAICMVFSGIGLLRLHIWARYLALATAATGALVKLAHIAHLAWFVLPTVNRIAANHVSPEEWDLAYVGMLRVFAWLGIATLCILLLFDAAVLVVLTRPGVVAAFRSSPTRETFASEEDLPSP